MTSRHADPGYGDPLAPVGSPDWAKRWRLVFQTAVKDLPDAPSRNADYYKLGKEHRAWTLLTDAGGNHFATWEAFCACEQPWGLGTDPAEFRRFVAPVMGDREFDLMTVPPGRQGERTDVETSPHGEGKSEGHAKQERFRAILRAPEVVQDLSRANLITQTVAAKLGPKSPTPEQAAQIAEARQWLEQLDRKEKPAVFRREAARVVLQALGAREKTPLDHLRRWWSKATPAQRQRFRQEITP